MSDERSRDADAFEGEDQTTTGATRPLTIATRGGIAIDFRTKRHEFTRREWAARQRQEARYQQEQAARARARKAADERLQRQLEDLGIAESDVKGLRIPSDEDVMQWLEGWPDHPERERILRALAVRCLANLELAVRYWRLPRARKLRLTIALERARDTRA
jgi:hypothetical protein